MRTYRSPPLHFDDMPRNLAARLTGDGAGSSGRRRMDRHALLSGKTGLLLRKMDLGPIAARPDFNKIVAFRERAPSKGLWRSISNDKSGAYLHVPESCRGTAHPRGQFTLGVRKASPSGAGRHLRPAGRESNGRTQLSSAGVRLSSSVSGSYESSVDSLSATGQPFPRTGRNAPRAVWLGRQQTGGAGGIEAEPSRNSPSTVPGTPKCQTTAVE